MNRHLVNAGYLYLEDGDYQRRKPTEAGKAIGIIETTGKNDVGKPYIYPRYTPQAREFIAAHMEDILHDRQPRLGSVDEG